MPTFTIERQTYCYEEGMGGWVFYQKRRFKNRKAAETAVASLNKRAAPEDSYRIKPDRSTPTNG